MVFIRLTVGMESFGANNIYHQSQPVPLLHQLASIFLVEVGHLVVFFTSLTIVLPIDCLVVTGTVFITFILSHFCHKFIQVMDF